MLHLSDLLRVRKDLRPKSVFAFVVGELQLKRGKFKELVSPPCLQTNDIPYDSLGLGGSGLERVEL